MNISRGCHGTPAAGCLLRRHIRRRTEHGAGLGQFAIALEPPGQPEIGYERLALVVDQDIGGLQVAVQDTPLMGVVNGAGDGGRQPSRRSRVAVYIPRAVPPGSLLRSASC